MMLAALDIGGTKTHLRLVTPDGATLEDAIVPSTGWSALPVSAAADWIVRLLEGFEVAGVVAGVQGCEERKHCDELATELGGRLGVPAQVVNDAELLIPAAGLERGLAVIVGTGAIAVAVSGSGELIRAGGWGWVLSDDGSASALVREAARTVLRRADRGLAVDSLGKLLLDSAGVQSVAELAHVLSWGGAPETWGRHSHAVVQASRQGSEDAVRVLAEGARSIASLLETLQEREVLINDVVVAGGLVSNVPEYWEAIAAQIRRSFPRTEPMLLAEPPVAGAAALAVRLFTGRQSR